MPEEQEKVKAKKWIIAIAVLVLIAVIVTLIIVFIPKNSEDLSDRTQAQVERNIQKDDKDFALLQTRINNISEFRTKYKQKVDATVNFFDYSNSLVEFYAKNIRNAVTTAGYTNDYNAAIGYFNNANKYNDEAKALLAQLNDPIKSKDSSFIESTWKNTVVVLNNYFSSLNNATKRLYTIYKNCVTPGMQENDLTYIVLTASNDYFDVLLKDYDEKVENNSQFNNRYQSFVKFANYYGQINDFYKYNFCVAKHEEIESALSYLTIYGENNFVSLIESITISLNMDKEPIEADEGGNALQKAKEFLTGGFEL